MAVTRTLSLVALLLVSVATPSPATEPMSPGAIQRLTEALAGRRVAREEDWVTGAHTRAASSLRHVFQQTVGTVPLVISTDALGSGIVVGVNDTDNSAWVITNHHVVKSPFQTDKGVPFVLLLFYDRELAAERFNVQQLKGCLEGADQGPWCTAVTRSRRLAVVRGIDPDRDLALLAVSNLSPGISPVPIAAIQAVEPGDDVAVIGHPEGLLWTLTVGIVSGVRARYPMGNAQGTVIQTQTPIAPGSSGGPLLTPEGRLLGVITWGLTDRQGLNAAIAINEVQVFAREQAKRFEQR